MFQIQRQKQRQSRNRKIIIVSLVVLVLAAAGVTTFYARKRSEQARLTQAFTPNPQTELGNESKDDENATNTSEQNKTLTQAEENKAQATVASNPSLPTPLLVKSSGNNGSVPVGAGLEFTCTAPAGYDCSIRLTGPKTINLEKKKLQDNGRGQAVTTWNWSAEKGSWTVVALLSNASGEKASAAQALEVK